MNFRDLPMRWDSEEACFRVEDTYRRVARRQYVHGEVYPVGVHEQRSTAAHAAYFASVGEAWKNLPEADQDRYPTPDHLRKWALVATGWCDEKTLVCSSEEHANRVAAFVKPYDEYAVYVVKGEVLKVYTPKSQSMYGPQRMKKEDFQRSADDVLGKLSEIIGVRKAEIKDNAGMSA